MSSIIHTVNARNNHETTRINALKVERKKATFEIELINCDIAGQQHDQSYVKAKLQPKMVAALAKLESLEKQIANRWVPPTAKEVERIDALALKASHAAIDEAFAETDMNKAIREERPRAEKEARARYETAQKDRTRFQADCMKAMERVGLAENGRVLQPSEW